MFGGVGKGGKEGEPSEKFDDKRIDRRIMLFMVKSLMEKSGESS